MKGVQVGTSEVDLLHGSRRSDDPETLREWANELGLAPVQKRPVTVYAKLLDAPVNIETLEGVMVGEAGDYLIQGVKGELYPCKPDVFHVTYSQTVDPIVAIADAMLLSVTDLVSVERAVHILNEINMLDPEVLGTLIQTRVVCNEKLAGHPTVQVGVVQINDEPRYHVGLLGIINGIFGIDSDSWGFIECELDVETGQIVTFRVRTADQRRRGERT